MPFASQYKNFQAAFTAQLLNLKLLGLNLLLSAGVSTLCFSTSASAAETITLIYNETLTSTSITDIQAFVSRDEMTQDLQELFQQIPQTPESMRNLLIARIPLSRSLVERNFRNSTGQFLLILINCSALHLGRRTWNLCARHWLLPMEMTIAFRSWS